MYLIVIGVLSVILAFPTPPYPIVREPGAVVGAVTAATILPPLLSLWLVRRGLRRLEADPEDPESGQASLASGMSVAQATLALGHGATLVCTTWLNLCDRAPLIGDWPLAPSLLAILPFMVSILLTWITFYPGDRAVRQIAFEMRVLQGRPSHPVWGLGEYLVFNLRHQVFFILLPMLVILTARDLIDRYQRPMREAVVAFVTRNGAPAPTVEFLPDLLLGLVATLVAILAPLMLRYVWLTRPLPVGPLRDRLERLCRKLRMRCSEILVWYSNGMIVNAAVMGVFAPLRYVMITDAMLEQMDDTKIEAVFGHEAGHVKRSHIWYFLLFAFISGCLITILSAASRKLSAGEYQVASAIIGLVLLLKWGVVFGWVSRRFERQADLYGVRTLAIAGEPCALSCGLHGEPDASAPKPAPQTPIAETAPLCATAAHIFADTLHDVARLNGIPPEARSWRHGSIANRSRTVERLAHDPQAAARFERSVRWIKRGILAAAILSGLWACWAIRLWTLFGLRLFESP